MLDAAGERSVVVLDDRGRPGRLAVAAAAQGRHDRASPTEDLVNLDHRATLNDALDTMLSSSHGGAVVTGDRDQYLGVVDFTSVTEYIRALESQDD